MSIILTHIYIFFFYLTQDIHVDNKETPMKQKPKERDAATRHYKIKYKGSRTDR